MISFLRQALSNNGEPSSKRLAAFMVLTVVLATEIGAMVSNFQGMSFDTLVTYLTFVAVSLGISEFSKGLPKKA